MTDRAPLNPARLITWAVICAAVALAGFIALGMGAASIPLRGSGISTVGFFLFIPFAALAVAVVLIVAAVRSAGAWRVYASGTTTLERRTKQDAVNATRSYWPLLIVGVICAVFAALQLVELMLHPDRVLNRPAGLAIFLVIAVPVAAAAWGLIATGLRWRASRRRSGA